jgi:biotin carboxyl carrier protein
MKNYTITVNGNVYQVTVEEGTTAGVIQNAAPAPETKPAETKPAAGNAGKTPVVAPMPGKILSLKAKAGDPVKKGQVVLILEAMKMENEITAPCDGVVKQIMANKGAVVSTGDTLLVI